MPLRGKVQSKNGAFFSRRQIVEEGKGRDIAGPEVFVLIYVDLRKKNGERPIGRLAMETCILVRNRPQLAAP